MANVRQFNLDLKKFGDGQFKLIGQLQRRAAFVVMKDLVQGSPVDTGRFRGSWMVGIGVPNRAVISDKMIGERGSYGEGKRQRDKRVRQNTRLTSPESMARLALLTPETVNGREPIIISNNLPYAVPLADGHSKQAPSGWVQAAVARAKRELDVVKVRT